MDQPIIALAFGGGKGLVSTHIGSQPRQEVHDNKI